MVEGDVVSEGTAIFCPPKHFDFLDPQLAADMDGNEIVVRASALARLVWVESDDPDLLLSVSLSAMYARHIHYTRFAYMLTRTCMWVV